MFQHIFTLTRLLIKSGDMSFQSGSLRNKGKSKRRLSRTAMAVLYVFVFGYMGVIGYLGGRSLTRQYMALGLTSQFAEMMLPVICLIIALFGFTYIVTSFYYSGNTERLLALPFRPLEIVAARLLQVAFYLYISVGVMVLPLLISFGVTSGQGPLYYPAALLVFIGAPFVALGLPTVIIMLLVRFTRLLRNRDRFMIVSSIILIGLILFVSMNMSASGSGGQNGAEIAVNAQSASRFQAVNWLFLGIGTAARFLNQSDQAVGWLYGLLFLMAAAAWVIVILLVAQRIYFQGVSAMGGSDSKRTKLSERDLRNLQRGGGAFRACLQKEWRLLFRTPAFLLNNVLMCFLMPLIILIPLITQFPKSGASLESVRRQLNGLFGNPAYFNKIGYIALLTALGVGLFLSGINGLAATAISREGKNAWQMSLYPYPLASQLRVKYLLATALSLITPLLLLLPAVLLLDIPALFGVPALILLILSVFAANFLGLICDMRWPRLNWSDETQAVKQNPNFMVEMFGSMLLAGLGIGLLVLARQQLHLDYIWLCLIALIYLLLLNGLGIFFFTRFLPLTREKIGLAE